MFLGIEIGGTKLQLGLGPGDGSIVALEQAKVDASGGAKRIRERIVRMVPELLDRAGMTRSQVRAVGIGFGGPVDAARGVVTKSHQVEGWAEFPLANWSRQELGWPTVVHNDADTAGLAEACFGAGRDLSPIFYITIGSGIGGGLIIDQQIYRGSGAGAAEIGHLVIPALARRRFLLRPENDPPRQNTVESMSSGWAIEQRVRNHVQAVVSSESRVLETTKEWADPWQDGARRLLHAANDELAEISVELIAREATAGNKLAEAHLTDSIRVLAWSIAQMIALVCPRRIVIGGGVASIGDQLFEPLRRAVASEVFVPFKDSYDIQPASLGKTVVVHGALRLACSVIGDG